MQISVVTLTGIGTKVLMSRLKSTILALKAAIADHWQIPIPGQMLVHRGRLLSEVGTANLFDLGVKSGDTIIIFFSHRRHHVSVNEQQTRQQEKKICSAHKVEATTADTAQIDRFDPGKVQLLYEMGFRSIDLVRHALTVNRNNIEQTIHWLTKHATIPSEHVARSK
uniref:UBA domain-containing protein n=1 Tax=Spongospora subterranea TaxID=70186 RepID=A0A0H5QLU6_9EUKA|eukprot:CRZ03130.1 hypothetical protein [Spongospora subterranea]